MVRAFGLVIGILLSVVLAGCDSGSSLVNPDQPRDLGPPWVNKTDTEFGSLMVSSDAARNRVFSCRKDEFRGLIESIAAEYNAPVAVKPKKMLDWNLTVEVKGQNLDEVLKNVAERCRLSFGKSSSGLALLSFPGDASNDEFVVKPEGDDASSDDE